MKRVKSLATEVMVSGFTKHVTAVQCDWIGRLVGSPQRMKDGVRMEWSECYITGFSQKSKNIS